MEDIKLGDNRKVLGLNLVVKRHEEEVRFAVSQVFVGKKKSGFVEGEENIAEMTRTGRRQTGQLVGRHFLVEEDTPVASGTVKHRANLITNVVSETHRNDPR